MQASSEKAFTAIVAQYIEEKRAMGFKFGKAAQILRTICLLQEETDKGMPVLSKELFERWAQQTSWETQGNRTNRISVLRGLSDYMIRMGYTAVPIPVRYAPCKEYGYTPYIFSDEQLGAILHAVDESCSKESVSQLEKNLPLIFRLLIGCGLRATETLNIRKGDVNVEEMTILLRKTKNMKERIIPIAASLNEHLRIHLERTAMIPGYSDSGLLFQNGLGKPHSSDRLYWKFREYLWKAGIPHRGRGKGPRLHDLRHTYAVRIMNKWVRDGHNLTTSLPYLAIYMGHSGLKASQHYLRMVSQMYPHLLGMVDDCYGWVIPEVQHEEQQ
ncbi:MAG: tyrosine-type recombinase/integrase [Sphaerochaeta sp.]|jgi:integrase|uniref:tyrosine-type recombinase/integrase n=1 Tax=Sphaerochaeta sp. TaxID=1972642 RepID=UPI0025874953|nr:tyrosine-type recombinase/integrase [Sphaerochaeta sp.]MDD3058858.1 tyrosine-type recombinase/integrase [Sphaerochaeta sp.]MDD4039159.1 tyrosine-type recombinase/integrase [Sphaerochaeta sp.]MDX9985700.1 tyrosine-type recombinase/integrase [Sphaerochaeta sp.]